MPPNRYCSEAEAAQIVTLYEEEYRQKDIARRLRRGQSTVSNILKRYQETGNFVRRPGQGRKRCTTAIDDRFLILNSTRNRTLTHTSQKSDK